MTKEQPLVNVRKYKNFTSIYLLEVSEKAFIESRKKYDELKSAGIEYLVVRINRKAYMKHLSLHPLNFSEINGTPTISHLGTTFHVIGDTDGGLKEVGHYDRDINDRDIDERLERKWTTSFMWGNTAHAFLEICYKNTTGMLLFF